MKILILDQYYPQALSRIYASTPKPRNYTESHNSLIKFRFSTSDFYSKGLKKNNCDSIDIVINDDRSQRLWAKENGGIRLNKFEKFIDDNIIKKNKTISDRFATIEQFKIVSKQIDKFRPEIVYLQNISFLNPLFLYILKRKIKLLVGQIACPMPPKIFFKPYDLIITSFPHYIEKFRKIGLKSKYLPLCFESSIISEITRQKRKFDVTFVGGISRSHKKGFEMLNFLADNIKLDVWGYGKESLDKTSTLYDSHHGEAWGLDMYKILLQSKITINRHIDVAENNANNMRLFEATGCGSLLITDDKSNLKDLFEVGKEIVTYNNNKELLRKVKYYLKHKNERDKIALAGQKRTLSCHNYSLRMSQLLEILNRQIKNV